MNRTEAAEILANLVVVTARKYGWTGKITNEMIDIVVTEAQTETCYEGGGIRRAGLIRPANSTIRAAGRRAA